MKQLIRLLIMFLFLVSMSHATTWYSIPGWVDFGYGSTSNGTQAYASDGTNYINFKETDHSLTTIYAGEYWTSNYSTHGLVYGGIGTGIRLINDTYNGYINPTDLWNKSIGGGDEVYDVVWNGTDLWAFGNILLAGVTYHAAIFDNTLQYWIPLDGLDDTVKTGAFTYDNRLIVGGVFSGTITILDTTTPAVDWDGNPIYSATWTSIPSSFTAVYDIILNTSSQYLTLNTHNCQFIAAGTKAGDRVLCYNDSSEWTSLCSGECGIDGTARQLMIDNNASLWVVGQFTGKVSQLQADTWTDQGNSQFASSLYTITETTDAVYVGGDDGWYSTKDYPTPATLPAAVNCLANYSYRGTFTSTGSYLLLDFSQLGIVDSNLRNVRVRDAGIPTTASQEIYYPTPQSCTGTYSCEGTQRDVWPLVDYVTNDNTVRIINYTFILPAGTTEYRIEYFEGDALSWEASKRVYNTSWQAMNGTQLNIAVLLTRFFGAAIEADTGSGYTLLESQTPQQYPGIAGIAVWANVSNSALPYQLVIDTTSNSTVDVYIGNTNDNIFYNTTANVADNTQILNISDFTQDYPFYKVELRSDQNNTWYVIQPNVNATVTEVRCNDYQKAIIDNYKLNAQTLYISTWEIPLEVRDLIHWQDGSAQYRGNIPTTNNSQINLYVLNPSFYYVVFQDILFVDLTNQFPPGQTTVTWQGFVSGNLVSIHQSYLDSDYNAYAYLENQGQYKLIIQSPYATREIGWITISATTASRTISIINQPFIPITIWQTTQLNITSDNSTGTIRVDYYDISNQTTNLKTYIYLQHNQTPIYTSDLNTSHAAVTYIGNTSLNYLVRVYATHGNTTDQVVQAITFNNGVFNLYLPDTLFDQPKVYWTTIACLVALTFTAFIFGAYFAGLCNIVIFTELASFVYFGWMIINIETLAFIGLIGFLSVLTSRRRTQ